MRLAGSDCKTLERSVVFPVPASPVKTTKPLCCRTAYVKPARASRCCAVKNKNAGSGVMLNGFLDNPKRLLYIRQAPDVRFITPQLARTGVLEFPTATVEPILAMVPRQGNGQTVLIVRFRA